MHLVRISAFCCFWQVEENSVGTLRVEVTDTGAGLSEEEQNAIFGEFTQFNKNKLQGGGRLAICFKSSSWIECQDANRFLWIGGSGLGLWISRRIIHMHKVLFLALGSYGCVHSHYLY